MGIDMATTNAPFGLQPWGKLLGANLYTITNTIPTYGIYHGDLVEHNSTTLATPGYGSLVDVLKTNAGATGSLLGAVLGLYTYQMDPVMYLLATATGNGTIGGLILVADHPLQEFIVQEDGVTSSLQIADMGTLRTMTAVAAAGSNATGISSMVLDSNNTTNPAVKVLKPHPDDTISAAGAAGNYCRFVVQVCTHVRAADVGSI